MSTPGRDGPRSTPAPAPVSRPDDIRRHNLALLLQEVHRHGAMTRADLVQRLELSRSTVGTLVSDLCEQRVLAESVPVGGERAGRPSHVVAPRADGPYALAVDVEVDRLAVAAVTVGGGLALRRHRELPPGDRSGRAVAGAVAAAVGELAAAMPEGAWPVGLVVSVPGTVRAATGVVEVAPNLGWQAEPFTPELQQLLPGLPLEVANDADMGVLGEHLRGAARDSLDVVYVLGKVGVGAGILVDGRPLRGSAGLAGELGHTVMDRAGRPCHCGGRGCVEGLIGERALLRLAGSGVPDDPGAAAGTVAEVLADARGGRQPARDGVAQVARTLGSVLANLVNLLNPEVIVLGGSLAQVYECLPEEVLGALDAQGMAAARRGVAVRVSGLGEDSALLGAAELAFRGLMADPLAAGPGSATGWAAAQRPEPAPLQPTPPRR
jgi:predicted NBD/HSP70 family sugar kinase